MITADVNNISLAIPPKEEMKFLPKDLYQKVVSPKTIFEI